MVERKRRDTSVFRAIGGIAHGLALAGCSYVSSNMPEIDRLTRPREPILMIDSTPQGAEARTSYGGTCQTPCELAVPVTDEFTVTFTLDGYLPQTVSVRPVRPEKAALIDTTPPELSPNPVMAELAPAPPPPPPARKRQRP